jgi:hypothetical protein
MMLGMSIVVLDWIIKIIYIGYAIPIAMLAMRFRFLTPAQKWFLALLLMHLVTGITSEFIYRKLNINPNYAASVYYIVVVFLYVEFFRKVMDFGRLEKALYAVAITHSVFSLCNLLFVQKETLNTYSAISLSIIIISLCLYFFYRLLKNLPTDNLLSVPLFWFITAEFMTNAGQMLFKSFAHFLINIFNDNLIVLWVFHHGLGIAGQLVVIYGVWLVFVKYRGTTTSAV